MVDTLTTLTPEAKEFREMELLYRAKASQIFYKFGKNTKLPKNGGDTVSWRRFDALAVATTPLTEGVTPVTDNLAMSEVTGTVVQHGNFVGVSDKLADLGIDQVTMEATDVLGQNGGETTETLVANVIKAGTNVIYGTGSTRIAQSAANPMSLSLIRKAIANLDINKTHRIGGTPETDKIGKGRYICFVHPAIVFDLYNDSELKTAFQQNASNGEAPFFTGALGMAYNVEFYQSTLCPVFTGEGAGGVDVYGSIIIGKDAFGVTDVAGKGKYEMITKWFGSAGTADPLDQRATIGWKNYFLAKILNNNFMVRVETGTTYV